MDGAQVGAGSLWPCICTDQGLSNEIKCMMGGTMVWEISTWGTKQKQSSFLNR
jgi:hypothetical protein